MQMTAKPRDIQDEAIPMPVTDRDNWRPIPEKKRHLCSIKGIEGFGNIVPLWTNGIIVQARRHDGTYVEVHLENVEWPVKLTIDLPRRTVTVKRAVRTTRSSPSLLDLESLLT